MNQKEITWLFNVFGISGEEIERSLNTWLRVEVILSILNLRGERSSAEIVRDGRLLSKQILGDEEEK